ncbi:IGPS-domain-containing protein [Tuber magnatum]|uniref:Multifunctional tryptophan biosynthesis protein n=1 Tax=Tuber magnatum TaxID=42249 RepID=A0A317SIJ1_9PEZI|nr:IGPS-domain-containing protein [Tuber magnatum]
MSNLGPAQPALSTATNVIMIDNYDSFTWNIYQFLTLEGAKVTVYRNDKITLPELIALNPTQIVISPGPGHPITDSGVSIECVKHFAGKIPILGVCMGQQAIFSAFGGAVEYAGEVVHGKTSLIKHDAKGIYRSIPQEIAVTRYHSLAGTHATLPADLEITSWTDRGVIMGIRHKEYAIEAVQYHPESILTEEGRIMFRNFLEMTAGTWKGCEVPLDNASSENRTPDPNGATKSGSILDKIYAHRRAAVAAQKLLPSQRPADLEVLHSLSISPPLIDFPTRLRSVSTPCALMAEIKRASPSKGLIDIDASAAVQARTYALAGAATISVLTEPEWFKGSIDDLRVARQAVDGMPNRPAILRKEFIFEEYQILEARLAGADTVLLIVKMLSDEELKRLYDYSKSIGMEPLVEVNSREEMERALKVGSTVIGVNNRDLHSFKVDLETTSGLVGMIDKEKVVLCALSGISAREDVKRYESEGVGAVLVGEALMRAGKNVKAFINELLSDSPTSTGAPSKYGVLVKICGTRSVEAAKVAVESGADMVGMILAEGTKRTVDLETAKAISDVVRSTPKGGVPDTSIDPNSAANTPQSRPNISAEGWFEHSIKTLIHHPKRSLLVGVFRNQSFPTVLALQKALALDIIQLHGSEPGCIQRSFAPGPPNTNMTTGRDPADHFTLVVPVPLPNTDVRACHSPPLSGCDGATVAIYVDCYVHVFKVYSWNVGGIFRISGV